MSLKKFLTRATLFLVLVFFLISILIIAFQDFLVFPSLTLSQRDGIPSSILPPGVTTQMIDSSDGAKIEVWRYEPSPPANRRILITFHGNGETLPQFSYIPEWFQSIGYTVYSFDYRGIGHSTGWPSESGIYADGEAVWGLAKSKDNALPSNTAVLGQSIGTGPSSQLASVINPRALVLISPYTSLKAVVRGRTFYKLFTPFLKYEFPTKSFITKYPQGCLILTHGRKDTVIPVEQGQELVDTYSSIGAAIPIMNPVAGHNDIFWNVKDKLQAALTECMR